MTLLLTQIVWIHLVLLLTRSMVLSVSPPMHFTLCNWRFVFLSFLSLTAPCIQYSCIRTGLFWKNWQAGEKNYEMGKGMETSVWEVPSWPHNSFGWGVFHIKYLQPSALVQGYLSWVQSICLLNVTYPPVKRKCSLFPLQWDGH